ncbi:hypothetical protein CG471_11735 [Sphingobium sp. IP1]|uniref:phage virion morphogenesis protein n=1 Tax=Sphingobium sp. IP1 TaxID=2021637 RepID=UPI000C06A268|nr:phage virion morphogenesis protein [Sphingobium sp. IP1]PHP19523.1 hypothetical protein CG471_11735 [Sphingobium sp. IP1]
MGAGFDLSIRVDDAMLNEAVGRAILAGSNLREPMGHIAEDWMVHARGRFAQERDPFGVPWMKRRIDPDQPINVKDASRKVLHKKGALERALVPDFGSDFAQIGVLQTAGPAKYARIHNEGGTIKPRNKKALKFGNRVVSQIVMPKRQYVGFGPDEERIVIQVLRAFLAGLFSKVAG